MTVSTASFLIRFGIAFVWLFTGLAVFHPTYRAIGLSYLTPLGLPEWMMHAACALEVVLGLWVLCRPASTWITVFQIAMISAFTLILSIQSPELLAHPFGVLSKNGSLMALIVTAWLLQREGWSRRAESCLRFGMAFIWIWEGLLPCLLYPQPALVTLLDQIQAPFLNLPILGTAEIASGLLALTMWGWPRQIILYAQAIGLVFITLLVSCAATWAWFHPFGPLTKNVPLFLGTVVLLFPPRRI